MKGYRFYEEFTNKRKGESAGNVFALSEPYATLYPEGLGAIFEGPDSPVVWTGVSWEWLRADCKRVSEARARQIHPALFKRLDGAS